MLGQLEAMLLASTVTAMMLCVSIASLRGGAMDVYPDDHDTNCRNLSHNSTSLGLGSALSQPGLNNTSIHLKQPGCYYLHNFSLVANIRNISIAGSGKQEDYIIQCDYGIGLAFVSITELSLKNLTIVNCSLSGANLNQTVAQLNDTVDLFYKVPDAVRYSLFIGDCSNVNITDITIRNTTGIGLLAINVMGYSVWSHITLNYNNAKLCFFQSAVNTTSPMAIGGGAFILYQDYHAGVMEHTPQLIIKDSNMTMNSYCSSFSTISALYTRSSAAKSFGYLIGGGALGISLAQLRYSVEVTINSSSIVNNTGWVGSGINIVTFSGVNNSRVVIANCEVWQNGFADFYSRPLNVPSVAGGLLVANNFALPRGLEYKVCKLCNSYVPSTIEVVNTSFSGNRGYYCGSIHVSLYQSSIPVRSELGSTICFINCTMKYNEGAVGSSFCGISTKIAANFSNADIEFRNVTVRNNTITKALSSTHSTFNDGSGHVVLYSTIASISGTSSFIDNFGVPIIGIGSFIYFQGDIKFANNSGVYGGALRLTFASTIIIRNDTSLQFINNSASVQGGAIFANFFYLVAEFLSTDCFLYFNDLDILCNYTSCPDITRMSINVTFSQNQAPYGGTIYGSTLSTCPWYYSLNTTQTPTSKGNRSGIELLSETKQFNFNPYPNNALVVSTESARIEIANSSTNFTVSPGERLSLNIKAYDYFGYRTSAVLTSLSNNPRQVSTHLSDSVFYYISQAGNGTITPVYVSGTEDSVATIQLFATGSDAETNITLQTHACGYGFLYGARTCTCPQELERSGVECSTEDGTLTIPNGKWFGPLTTQQNDAPVYHDCYYDYCKLGIKTVSSYNLDAQCNEGYHREGLLCGHCKSGLSTLFGSSRCKQCSNYWLFWIVFFAVAGIVVVFGISILDITVTHGYVNGFLFYCNCINYFTYTVAVSTSAVELMLIPVAWSNLALGIESCFYDGMSMLSRVSLRLVFPAYLFVLMGVITLLARSSYFSRVRFSASKAFATLLLLCYFNIFGTCMELVGFVHLTGIYNNVSYYGWQVDPSVEYGKGVHGVLVFVAVLLLLLYILPFSVALLFPRYVYSIRFLSRFKPIYDALWNSYKVNYRFYLGLRAILRFVPFFVSLYVHSPVNIFVFVLFIAAIWYAQERIQPYEGYWRNAIDSFFLVDLMLLFVVNLFFTLTQTSDQMAYKALIYLLLVFSYAMVIVIIIIHIFLRFPKLKMYLKNFMLKVRHQSSERDKIINKPSHSVIESLHGSNQELFIPDKPKYSVFREPLLDDYGSVSLTDANDVSI